MLYIFHVETGTTITFDIELALQNVSELQEAIERECGVVAEHQVLLMSGGESLEPDARVCSYFAGTDTNPIYLFSRAAIVSPNPPTPSIYNGSDVDLQSQIDSSLSMPATYQTLVARAQLAQQCCGLAREQTRICERLVHDQHLQQQAWSAVVANLEDTTQMFQSKAELFQQSYSVYLAERQQYMNVLENFSSDLGSLAKIPILPALRARAEGFLSPEDQQQQQQQSTQPEKEEESRDEVLSLHRWISAKENQCSLEQFAEQCSRGLEQFDERVMQALKAEVDMAVDAANKQGVKEIKGLGERLFGLEQLMVQTKKLVQEQGELAQGFLQNQSRANNLGDASVLPDLCTSHRRQLVVMLQNHNQLRDIRRRCTKAKEELSVNIYQRLKWIMYVENKMMEVNNKLAMYHDNLKRLRGHLDVLQQIHLAPHMYMTAVAEVVRRRTFSQAFLLWASNLACQLLTVHSEELARRREFQSKFDGHFLNTLFPGLEDTPPPFATQAPSVFDNGLPKLTVEDMELLKAQLPDVALTVSRQDLNSITQFFLSKSLTEGSTDSDKEKSSLSMRVDAPAKEQERTRAPMLIDRGGFESETDTEEFEKIGQGGTDSKPGSFDSAKQLRQKELEVGASRSVSPASSTSTNVSPLNSKAADLTTRSSSSNEPGSFHFPTLSTSERPSQLSPLTECAENGESSCSHAKTREIHLEPAASSTNEEPHSLSPNPSPLTRPMMCDGQQQQHQHQHNHHQHYHHQLSGSDGSSPSLGVTVTDFMGTEFYMDESLPSSLSEHPADGQHQAIVSLLQENLGNAREVVENLRSILKTMKAVIFEALASVRTELTVLRDQSTADKSELSEMSERVREALSLYSRECDRRLREREQELTVDHELEMADVKKLMQSRDEEICSLKRNLQDKETDLQERDHLIATMHQKVEVEKTEMRGLLTLLHQQLQDALEQARIEKEEAVQKATEDKCLEIVSLSNAVTQCQQKIRQLEEKLSTARNDQQKTVTELETIRGRFKGTATATVTASSMERNPSDSSLEKIEKPDVFGLGNHGCSQTKNDSKEEKSVAMQDTTDNESNDCVKLDQDVPVILSYDGHILYKDKISRILGPEYDMSLEYLDIVGFDVNRTAALKKLWKNWSSGKEEAAEVSDSKRVRLEEADDSTPMYIRLEMLEQENMRLNAELQAIREGKESAEAKVEALQAEKVHWVVELVKERSRKNCSTAEACSSAEGTGRDRDMNASVSVVSESGSGTDAATSPELSRRRSCSTCCHWSSQLRKLVSATAWQQIQQGRISVTSCNRGDTVLILWDAAHASYTLYQENPKLYFLHTDCMDALFLRLDPDGIPKQMQVIAEVVSKEYCHARKPGNRYNVPVGTKFYRVHVKAVEGAALSTSQQL